MGNEDEAPAFTSADCTVFSAYTPGVSWTIATVEDQEKLRSVRRRLKSLAARLIPAASAGVPMSSLVSTLNPNGRIPGDLWCCVFPQQVSNKSFALQFALIISAHGAEICCCLGSGTTQLNDAASVAAGESAWESLRKRLAEAPETLRQEIESSLRGEWQFRTSWRLEAGRSDFSTFADWLSYASSNQGAGASISMNLTPEEFEQKGPGIADLLSEQVAIFAPLFLHSYDSELLLVGPPLPKVVAERLHPVVASQLRAVHGELMATGELLSVEALARHYETFRARFGPDVLLAVDGEALLQLMHDIGNREGLPYWLEFKNDEEFPKGFGSISGGSALKYGLYRRRETGTWMTGSSKVQHEISTTEAVGLARHHRDQLVAACGTLASFPGRADDDMYAKLQRTLDQVAPDVSNLAWGHKYLSLIYPDKLDDYHAPHYQRFHLRKMLEIPPVGDGRYSCAGRFVRVAAELGWPMNQLDAVLNRRNGPPYRVWRIGTRGGDDEAVSFWEMMRDRAVVAIGWKRLGDLSQSVSGRTLKGDLRTSLDAHYPAVSQVTGQLAQQITHFCQTISDGDYVVASDGVKVLGIGRVIGPYRYDASAGVPHQRPVEWLALGEWYLPITEGLRTTVRELKNNDEDLVAIERKVLEASVSESGSGTKRGVDVQSPAGSAEPVRQREWIGGGVVGRIQDVLKRKGQVILYGPPGTGKTHWAEIAARELASLWNLGKSVDQLSREEKDHVFGSGSASYVQLCCFHPSYGYEDFVEGYRPRVEAGSLRFDLKDGIFKTLCASASQQPDKQYYLIIDEINRGDVPRIFGELLTLLEKTKRGRPATLPFSAKLFNVPANVFVIGTMNTADRSIALLDTALRRRFGFIEMAPDTSLLENAVIGGLPLGLWLQSLNKQISSVIGQDGRNLQIGHSYFLHEGRPVNDLGHLSRILQDEVLPLLEEYCYDNWDSLKRILGNGFVDVDSKSFRSGLFDANRQADLLQALFATDPEIATSAVAVAAEVSLPDPAEDEDADGK
ncbi:MAG: AAA family ATPase [Deltaproteobacteria bacterium]|nr:AAA family ATPase [Deltaproteobacteria bacterium]